MSKNHRNADKSGNKQYFNGKTKLWVEKDPETGLFVDVKTTGGKFKKVSKK